MAPWWRALGRVMAYRGVVTSGRKSAVPRPLNTKVAPEVLSLGRAFAAEYDLYLQEATSYLLDIGLSQHEGWILEGAF